MHSSPLVGPMLGRAHRNRAGDEARDFGGYGKIEWMKTEKKISRAKERMNWRKEVAEDLNDLMK